LGVERQEPPCRDLAERLGAEVIQVFQDNDLSAYSGRRRPAYEDMLQWARNGRVDLLIAWDADRFTRRPVEAEHLIDLVERHGIRLAVVTGDYDLATSDGRLHFRIRGAVARHESEKKAERQRLKHAELANAGKPHGGGSRLFGLTADRTSLVPEEAAVAQEIADRLLRGHSVRSIAAWLNASGVRTTTCRAFQVQTVRQLMRSAAIAGRRVSNGVDVGPATWPAVIPYDIWLAVQEVLATRTPKGRPTVYLLNKVVWCSLCDVPLKTHSASGKHHRAYACVTVPGLPGGCGKISCAAEPLERYVEAMALDALVGPGLQRALARTPGDVDAGLQTTARLLTIERKLREVGEAYDEDQIDKTEWLRRRNRLLAEQAALSQKRSSQIGQTMLSNLPTGQALLDAWPTWDVETKRGVLRELFVKVPILAAPVRGGRFNPDRVAEPEWRY
jgi:DNA invertase Pin-like site-specific DNA recombinase